MGTPPQRLWAGSSCKKRREGRRRGGTCSKTNAWITDATIERRTGEKSYINKQPKQSIQEKRFADRQVEGSDI